MRSIITIFGISAALVQLSAAQQAQTGIRGDPSAIAPLLTPETIL